MANFEKRFYISVSAYDEDYSDYTVPSGKTLFMTEMGANAAQSSDTKSEIVFDPTGTPEKLLVCHGDTVQKTIRKLSAGETVRIYLRNDSAQAESLGGFFLGELYDEVK